MEPALLITQAVLVFYVVTSAGFQTALLASAAAAMRRHQRVAWSEQTQRLLASGVTPTVSVLAPAYNEATTVVASVRSLLTLRYPRLEVVVINDGSTDKTLEVLRKEFELRRVHPSLGGALVTEPIRGLYRSERHGGLIVIDKLNGGKSDSLNAGLNVASGELYCAVDADTLIEPDAFLRIVRPFLADDRTVATGATIRVVNGSGVQDGRVVAPRIPARLLPGIQTVEYVRSFLFGRLGWNDLGGNLIVSGAFGMFRRDAVVEAGGYQVDTVGEDMELVVRLRRHGYETGGPSRVTFVPDPIAWTEVPESLHDLGRQRDRWQRGLADTISRHRQLIFNPRYRAMGLVAMPYFVVIELIGPALEAFGVLGLLLALLAQVANVSYALALLLLFYGWGVILSVTTVLLYQWLSEDPYPAGDVPRLILYALAENLGYRQLTVLWRLRGTLRYLRGSSEWGQATRTGFDRSESAAAS
jgi:cellulose synthase/poly-beta-1,6-N-acetylglucosamine synthase-like glycosyltransferase